MPLDRRLPGKRGITLSHEHDDLPAQALLVKLERRIALPIETQIRIQSHAQAPQRNRLYALTFIGLVGSLSQLT
jgi:hypothetical protein